MATNGKRKRTGSTALGTAPCMKRKTLILDQDKIDRAKTVLRTATESEAVNLALEMVSNQVNFQLELDAGFADLIGKGGFTDAFRSSLRRLTPY